MSADFVEIPAERIPPVASDQASSSKVVAGVLGFVTVIVAIIMISQAAEGTHKSRSYGSDAYEAGRETGSILAPILFSLLPAWFTFKSARNAKRALNAGVLAKTRPDYKWHLSGKLVITSDNNGVPQPEYTFRANGKIRAMLQVPRATVVDKQG